MTFQSFETWQQVTDHVTAGRPLWYQAPLDYQPVRIGAVLTNRGKIRVYPPTRDSDPFTVDSAHLDRFRRVS